MTITSSPRSRQRSTGQCIFTWKECYISDEGTQTGQLSCYILHCRAPTLQDDSSRAAASALPNWGSESRLWCSSLPSVVKYASPVLLPSTCASLLQEDWKSIRGFWTQPARSRRWCGRYQSARSCLPTTSWWQSTSRCSCDQKMQPGCGIEHQLRGPVYLTYTPSCGLWLEPL